MAERTQINIRIDNDLLSAIRIHCESQNLTQTEFVINAIKTALNLTPTPSKPTDIQDFVMAQLEPIHEELAELRAALGEFNA